MYMYVLTEIGIETSENDPSTLVFLYFLSQKILTYKY